MIMETIEDHIWRLRYIPLITKMRLVQHPVRAQHMRKFCTRRAKRKSPPNEAKRIE